MSDKRCLRAGIEAETVTVTVAWKRERHGHMCILSAVWDVPRPTLSFRARWCGHSCGAVCMADKHIHSSSFPIKEIGIGIVTGGIVTVWTGSALSVSGEAKE